MHGTRLHKKYFTCQGWFSTRAQLIHYKSHILVPLPFWKKLKSLELVEGPSGPSGGGARRPRRGLSEKKWRKIEQKKCHRSAFSSQERGGMSQQSGIHQEKGVNRKVEITRIGRGSEWSKWWGRSEPSAGSEWAAFLCDWSHKMHTRNTPGVILDCDATLLLIFTITRASCIRCTPPRVKKKQSTDLCCQGART